MNNKHCEMPSLLGIPVAEKFCYDQSWRRFALFVGFLD